MWVLDFWRHHEIRIKVLSVIVLCLVLSLPILLSRHLLLSRSFSQTHLSWFLLVLLIQDNDLIMVLKVQILLRHVSLIIIFLLQDLICGILEDLFAVVSLLFMLYNHWLLAARGVLHLHQKLLSLSMLSVFQIFWLSVMALYSILLVWVKI